MRKQFLGGEKQFKDFCLFLSIGKAYREIASQTSDYHELFKKLLPEPRRDLFEKIIDSLKSLDSSKNDIQSLKDKHEYIKSLLVLVDKIKYKQKHAFAGDCIALQFETEDLKNTIEVLKNRKIRLDEKQLELEKAFAAADKEKKYIDSQLEDYKQKDASGLIREEKTISERIKLISFEKTELEKIQEKLNEELSKLKEQHYSTLEKIKEVYKDFLSKFTKLSVSMPFSIGELIAFFERLIHMEIEESIESVKQLNFDDFYKKAGHFRDGYVADISKLENTLEERTAQIVETEEKIAQLEEQLEFVPDVEYYSEVVEEFELSMINFKPLYKGLVWNRGVAQREMDALEEFIGAEILCSFILKEDDFRKASEFVYKDYPGIRLISEKKLDQTKVEVPAWIKTIF